MPHGGDAGGQVIALGTPEDVAANEQSFTGHFLKRMFNEASVPISPQHSVHSVVVG